MGSGVSRKYEIEDVQKDIQECSDEQLKEFLQQGFRQDLDKVMIAAGNVKVGGTNRLKSRGSWIEKQSESLQRMFGDELEPSEVGELVGRGGASRMFAQTGRDHDHFESIGQFFARGSTLKSAIAFAEKAVAKTARVTRAERAELAKPQNRKKFGNHGRMSIALESAGADITDENNYVVNEMHFHNIGGARVFNYYGLDTIRTPDDLSHAGPHVRDTAIGVLMLDKYKIQERPGDPSNPFTFWPYQAYYVVPQGITFEECKAVGAAGADAGVERPLEVNAICQALVAMTQVASRGGFKRVFITGDCGYYALACEAFSKQLLCWGMCSWVPHPEGGFAAFRVPRFLCPALDLEVVLCPGTTQLVATPDPKRSLLAQLNGNVSIVTLTADTRGWYDGATRDALQKEYDPFTCPTFKRVEWCYASGEKSSMLDLVVRVNDSLLEGVAILKKESCLLPNIIQRLLEFDLGSVSYMVGLFLGHTIGTLCPENDTRAPAEFAWEQAGHHKDIRSLIVSMARDSGGVSINDGIVVAAEAKKKKILEAVSPFFEFLDMLLPEIVRIALQEEEQKELNDKQKWRAMVALVDKHGEPSSWNEYKLELAVRVQDTCMSLLEVDTKLDILKMYTKLLPGFADTAAGSGLPLGARYAAFYAAFNFHLNKEILGKTTSERTNAIDGDRFLLMDCRFVPGFGLQVAYGLTVWTVPKNYFWMGAITLRFMELAQHENTGKQPALLIHLECTELFSFSPYFQEFGIPCIDNVNAITIASRVTDAPVRFVNFKQHMKSGRSRPAPAALIADVSQGGDASNAGARFYRNENFPVRSPTECGKLYEVDRELLDRLFAAERERWANIKVAVPRFGTTALTWGEESYNETLNEIATGDTLYAASCKLDLESYLPVDNRSCGRPIVVKDAFVQYGPREDEDNQELDEEAFFGGEDLYDLGHVHKEGPCRRSLDKSLF